MKSNGMPYWFYKLKEFDRAKFKFEDINGYITVKLVNPSFLDRMVMFFGGRVWLIKNILFGG